MTAWEILKAELSPKTLLAEINLPYGRKVCIPVGTLSYHEWTLLGLEVAEPPVPRTLVGAKGEKLPNRDDVAYRREVEAASAERNYRRLALALEKGGTTVPGNTTTEKAKTIRETLDTGIAVALIQLLGQSAYGGEAALTAQADTFHGGSAAAADGA